MALGFAPTAPSPFIRTNQCNRHSLLARFPICLNLPEGNQQFFTDAVEAVKKEYRSSVRAKRLRCRKVMLSQTRRFLSWKLATPSNLIGRGKEQPHFARRSRMHSMAKLTPRTTS